MSLYSALRAGVSGLFAQSQSMAMISDNIANVSTNGYKLARPGFSSLVSAQGGSSGSYTAGSIRTQTNRRIDQSGTIEATDNNLDMSIVGDGFFAASDRLAEPTGTGGRNNYWQADSEIVYTRKGDFRRDANGNLQNNDGYYLLGWPRVGTDDTGAAVFDRTNLPDSLAAVTVSSTTGRPSPTRSITVNANINRADFDANRDWEITVNVYDRQGGLKTMRIKFDPVKDIDAGTNGITISDGDPTTDDLIEPYAFKITASFEGEDAPLFRNGGSSTTTPMYAIFDSVGDFKYFVQPVIPVDAPAATATDWNFKDADHQAVPGGIAATTGEYTSTSPNDLDTTALADGRIYDNGLLPPLPPSGSDVPLVDDFVMPSQLSTLAPEVVEEWYDLGAVSTDGAQVQYINQNIAGKNVRPDWRILGSTESLANAVSVDTAPGAAGSKIGASTVLLLDIDHGRDGFQFNGVSTSDGNTRSTPRFENDVQLVLNFGAVGTQDGLTLFNAPSVITDIAQDGQAVGQLEAIQVGEDGVVTAVYDNGHRDAIAQVPVVNFNSVNNLDAVDRNAFRETDASGNAIVREAGVGGAGSLAPASLEASNVDIALEFTKMIETQRAYSANTKIISTTDEMLDELIRSKR